MSKGHVSLLKKSAIASDGSISEAGLYSSTERSADSFDGFTSRRFLPFLAGDNLSSGDFSMNVAFHLSYSLKWSTSNFTQYTQVPDLYHWA